MLCHYHCGKTAKFTLKNGINCCSKLPAKCESVKKNISAGLKQKKLCGKTRYASMSPEAKDRMNWAKGKSIIPNERIFTENSFYSGVKQRIIKDNLIEYKCDKCKIDSWCGERIVLELDHINGNPSDNRLINLRYLCPNCHSQTPTYKGRNKNNGKIKITDQELLTAYEKSRSIRQTLVNVGLAAKGGNYKRLKKLLAPVVK